jgi:hypothetical protein
MVFFYVFLSSSLGVNNFLIYILSFFAISKYVDQNQKRNLYLFSFIFFYFSSDIISMY